MTSQKNGYSRFTARGETDVGAARLSGICLFLQAGDQIGKALREARIGVECAVDGIDRRQELRVLAEVAAEFPQQDFAERGFASVGKRLLVCNVDVGHQFTKSPPQFGYRRRTVWCRYWVRA